MWNLAGAVILSGLVIVFAILTILIGAIIFMGRILNRNEAKEAPAAPKPSVASPVGSSHPPVLSEAPSGVQSGISEQTVAVISAAVAAAMGDEAPGAYTITGIQRTGRPSQTRPVWGFAGMQQNTRPF